jgi:hypothetical protein
MRNMVVEVQWHDNIEKMPNRGIHHQFLVKAEDQSVKVGSIFNVAKWCGIRHASKLMLNISAAPLADNCHGPRRGSRYFPYLCSLQKDMLTTIDRYLQLRKWSLSRIVRMLLGLLTLIAGIDSGENFIALAGAGFMVATLFRVGCKDSCDVNMPTKPE